jgi:hypothetical protein
LVETVQLPSNSLPTNPDCSENPFLSRSQNEIKKIAAKAGTTLTKMPTDSFLNKKHPNFH